MECSAKAKRTHVLFFGDDLTDGEATDDRFQESRGCWVMQSKMDTLECNGHDATTLSLRVKFRALCYHLFILKIMFTCHNKKGFQSGIWMLLHGFVR